ncbi:MAG: sugar phosphate nucleotidyltransferase [Candidatus Aenigmatarchaeota archaeon]
MQGAIVLAAGKSSRFWPLNKRHKSLMKIAGKPILCYTIESLKKAGIRNIIIVQDKGKEIEKELGNYQGVRYIVQEKPLGMGDAILCAEDIVGDEFFVVNADRIDSGVFVKEMVKKAKNTSSKMVLAAAETNKPWLYGILEVDGDKAKNLIEKPKNIKSGIKIVGVYLLSKDIFKYLRSVKRHEYFFEDALKLYMKENDVRIVISDKENYSLKYSWDVFSFSRLLLGTLKPKIAKSVKIAKNVTIDGNIHIGKNTKIYENAVIRGPCYIGNNCVIGNNTLIRDYTNIEDNVVIGANCEVTRSIIQDNVHAHSGYIGDSIIGRGCMIGAGIITANVRLDREEISTFVGREKIKTGLKSFGAVIGENTKIGVRVSIMPGVLIGYDCIIGPNMLIKDNVESCKILK